MTEAIHVAFASDDAGVDGLAVAAWSAVRSSTRPVHVWIIEDGIDRTTQARLRAALASLPMSASVHFFPQRDLPQKLPSWWRRARWPLSAAARFQLAEILPAEADRCIYLDIDVLVGADLARLADTALEGCAVAMVRNSGMSEHDRDYVASLGIDSDDYCNSGVLLMDLGAWRREQAGSRLIELGCRMRPDLWFFDQDMLNTYFKGRCLFLDERWNTRNAGVEPAGRIIHFAGSPKPWHTEADRATAVGLMAWHRARLDAAFVAAPISQVSRWRKRWSIRWAQLQRKWMLSRKAPVAGRRPGQR